MKKLFIFLFFYLSTGTQISSAEELKVDDLTASMRASAAGMRIQNERLKIIAQNIANSNTTGQTPGADPYRRKTIFVKNGYDDKQKADVVQVDRIRTDKSDFALRYEPNHPAADEQGYVKYPNVDTTIENIDAKEAQRTFEANLNALQIAKDNQHKLLKLLE
jgi:flagellar basal-body rod protein FlgC